MRWLISIILPPTFDDEILTRNARWIYVHIVLGFATYFAMYFWALPASSWPLAKIQLAEQLIIFTTIVEIGLFYLLRLGHVEFVAWCQNILIFVCGTIAFLNLGGLNGPMATFFVMMVTISAVLRSPRMTLVISALSIMALISSYYLAELGFTSPYELGIKPYPEQAMFAVLFLGNTGLLIYLSAGALMKERADVKVLTSKLRNKNIELGIEKEVVEERVKARTAELAAVNQQLLDQAKELIEAKEKAEESDRAKSAFLASMSHEIRTPLTSIIGTADILREEIEGEDKELVDFIFNGGLRLMSTLNSVLDLAQLEGRGVELDIEMVDIRKQAKDTVAFFANRAQEKNLSIKLISKGKYSFNCLVDRAAFDRVLQNLMSNALKFTHQGEVDVILDTRKYEVDIIVKDTGIGMSPEYLPELFQRFSQESTGEKRAYKGNGLGLAICKTIVEMMEGTIRAESIKGKGSSFIVTFPRVVEEAVVIPGTQKEKPGTVSKSQDDWDLGISS